MKDTHVALVCLVALGTLSVAPGVALSAARPSEEEIWKRAAGLPTSECPPEITQGELRTTTPEGRQVALPLVHTSVDAQVSGFLSQVWVTQYFTNPSDRPIEAVYVFPLPQNAAVDNMEMAIGDRTIKAVIEEREEAKRIYNEAKNQGKTAALLEQERPNIFTQSVANIMPGDRIRVRIRYVQDLKYEDGGYEFVFPMVVGPRFVPGKATGGGDGFSPNTDQVPDGSRITPPVLKPGERSAHDIDVVLNVAAGFPIQELTSPSHDLDRKDEQGTTQVTLAAHDTLPNKDLIVRYRTSGETISLATLFHKSDDLGAYFMLLMLPDVAPKNDVVVSRELVFVMDCSGSMGGSPLAKSKEAVKKALKAMRPTDTFQIFEFSDTARGFASKPQLNTPENLKRALQYVDQLNQGGGTQMLEGIKVALDYPKDRSRVRLVMFLTDGYIGNEAQILDAISTKLGDTRLFSFGIGSSVNRYLLDKMAEVGRGAVTYVRQDESVDQAVERFYKRIESPVLVDVAVSAEGDAEILELFPGRIPDLFVGQPLVVFGKYKGHGATKLTVSGRRGDGEYKRTLKLDFPARQAQHQVLATLWARARIDYLMGKLLGGVDTDVKAEVVRLSKQYRVMSQYTAFVAVEEKVRNRDGKSERVVVPVEIPEGVSYQGVFGEEGGRAPYPGQGYGGGGLLSPAPSTEPTTRPRKGSYGMPKTIVTQADAGQTEESEKKADAQNRNQKATHEAVSATVTLTSCAVLRGETADREVEAWFVRHKHELEALMGKRAGEGNVTGGDYTVNAKLLIGKDGKVTLGTLDAADAGDDLKRLVERALKDWLGGSSATLKTGEIKVRLRVRFGATP